MSRTDSTAAEIPIPKGCRKDGRGRFVPEAHIKPIDKLRDDVVRGLWEKAEAEHRRLVEFKRGAFAEIAAFVSLSAEEYRVQIGGDKGNITLLSFDGEFKIIRAIAERIKFDERLQAAKELINLCLREWTEGARSEVALLVQDAFRADKQGEIATNRILALRRVAIEDERWKRAMDAINEAVQVVDSRSYLRFYRRDADGNYQSMSLDLSVV